MNMYNPQLDSGTSPDMVGARPSKAEAEAAARTLLLWAGDEPSGIGAVDLTAILARTGDATYPAFNRSYPRGFAADAAYVETLPDLQNGPESLIKGAKTGIQHVGISNFRLPVRFRTREGGEVQLETSVTGSVSLEANKKGINMSRIMRSFYKHAATSFSFEVIGAVLDSYLADLDSYDARIMMRLSYPMLKRSLRSGLEGYQYYNVALEMTKTEEATRRIIHLDYVYSSTCPCSLELSEHARRTRNQIATPHSQRSVARVSVELSAIRGALVRGPGRPLQRRHPHRDPGDGQARGRAGLRRAQRLEPDLRRGRRAPALRQPRDPTPASATSAWWRATRNRCTATTPSRSSPWAKPSGRRASTPASSTR